MGPDHGVDRCRVGDTVFNRTTGGVAAPVDVRGAVADGQATEPEPDIRLETRVGDLHVGEQGVTAAAFGQHLDLEPGGRQGLLGARTGEIGVISSLAIGRAPPLTGPSASPDRAPPVESRHPKDRFGLALPAFTRSGPAGVVQW